MSPAWPTRYLELNGFRAGYVEGGDGPALVFVHGWSLDYTYWQEQLDRFAADHYVVAYDRRGGAPPLGPQPRYRFDRLVADLDALIKALGLRRPVLCGHSMGGDLVLQYAVQHPAGLSGLVVADAPGIHNKLINRISSLLLNLTLRVLGLLLPRSTLDPLAPFLERLFYARRFRRSAPEAVAAWKKQYVTNTVPSILNSFAALAWRRNLKNQLGRIAAPTLLLLGSRDRIVSRRETERYHQLIPGSELRVIEGSGHMTMQEKPAEFNRLVAEFLRRLQSPGESDGEVDQGARDSPSAGSL